MLSSSPFRIIEHVVPGQHIREYPRATANEQEDILHLSVKQYIPLDNPNPQHGDVTIIAAHANGFPKELYEPLWEEIYARSKRNGFRIRSIWMADVAHQGKSGILNEDVLGNDPSWFDHPRDLLHFINLKREEMPQPIVGVGHSFGGAHLTQLSLMHPRLIHSLVLLDPVIQRQPSAMDKQDLHAGKLVFLELTRLSTYRRDLWPSRKTAAEGFKRSPFYKAWDPRVLDRWVQYGLREVPTAIYPLEEHSVQNDNQERPVTLTTTRHQEVFTFSRPTYDGSGNSQPINRVTHPDLDLNLPIESSFYRPEPGRIFTQLPYVRPSVLYIFAGHSMLSNLAYRKDKLAVTGTGIGGSGGAAEGRVREVFLENNGHLVAQEAPNECADAISSWFGPELQRWRDEDQAFRTRWGQKPKVEKMTVNAQWMEHMPPPERRGEDTETKKSSSKL
ncbi:hypothetical protein MAP00_003754 [Monascus purpureus]|nr:hypothetical protein MAP00_003754 [Monascus purpureus]